MISVFDLLLYLSLSPRVVAACSCCCRCGDEVISRSSSAGAENGLVIIAMKDPFHI